MLTFETAPAELDILDEELGLGRFVYPHRIPFVSGTRSERAEQRQRVFDHWHRLGRMSRDRLRGEFEDLLRLWARPDVLVTQVVAELTRDEKVLSRGGWSGERGVLSRQSGDNVRFAELRAGQVLPQLLEPLRAGVVSCSVRGVDAGRLTWFDTPDGRFFTTVEQLPDGAQRHTFTPADRARIGQWVRDHVNQHLTAANR